MAIFSIAHKRLYFSLHTFLMLFAAACLIPAVVVSAVAIGQTATAYKSVASAKLSDAAAALAASIESDLASRIAMMSLLASSLPPANGPAPATANGKSLTIAYDKAGFEGDVDLFYNDRDLPIKQRTPLVIEAIKAAAATNLSIVSNMSIVNGRPLIALAVPARTELGDRRVLVLTTTPNQMFRALPAQTGQLDETVLSMIDGTGRIVQRTRGEATYVGKTVPAWPEIQKRGTSRGVIETMGVDGVSYMLAYQALNGTPGWFIAAAEPLAVFNARWRDPLAAVCLGGMLGLLLAMGAVLILGRLITVPLQAIVRHSREIADGRPGTAPLGAELTPVQEFITLCDSFNAAEQALRRSEARYRTAAEAGALAMWRTDDKGNVFSAPGWEKLTGMPESDALGKAWMERLHPEDYERVFNAHATATERGSVDIEFRLRAKEGQWQWVRENGAPIKDDHGMIVEWVGALEDIDERRQTQEKITHLAHHDALTGLANRLVLHERLEHAIARAARGVGAALLYLDLDSFKEVNDTLGHGVGDDLLCAVADRLRKATRVIDCVARLGGDEFAIIQDDSAQPEAGLSLGSRLAEGLSAPYYLGDHKVVIGASVGVAHIRAGFDPEYYRQKADRALYRAKAAGRGLCYMADDDQSEDAA